MTRWPIERAWLVLGQHAERSQSRTSELRTHRACGLLGAAGLGKTYELQYLSTLDRADSLDVRLERFAKLGQSADSLEARLKRLADSATESTVIYLDALDEVMVPVRTTGLIVANWIREALARSRPALRISCRSAVWPNEVASALREVYGKDATVTAILQPLSEDDIQRVASARGVDTDAFLAAVESAAVSVLSQQPLTLNMLLRVFTADGQLPHRRTELFAKGVRILASDRSERQEAGTAIQTPVDELLEAAERLACITLLSGREIVDLADEPANNSLGLLELSGLPRTGRCLDFDCLDAIRRSGLCESEGDRSYRFAHRQFAEYLAGRRLARLLLHQSRAMLASGLGWRAGVAGPLRETAAFAAMESPGIANWITDCDPEVVGLSDVVDDALRRRAAANLIEKFRRHELTDTQVARDGIELAGFRYADAERDLGPLLQERGDGCEDVLELAIEFIEAWKLSTVSDDLATLVLDPTAPLQARKAAGYALLKAGTSAAKRKLLPLVTATGGDAAQDLKGLALQCNWPDSLSVPELLTAISPPRADSYHGAYDHFLFLLDREGFDAAGDRLQGLAWAHSFLRRGGDHEPCVRIAKRIAIAALDEIDQPGISEALVKLLLATLDTHANSPLVPARDYGTKDAAPPQPVLAGRKEVRRKLIDTLTAIAPAEAHLWWIGHETPGFHVVEDFPWLLSRAVDASFPMQQREHYAELARMLPWADCSERIDAWLALKDVEPVASRFRLPLSIDLNSEDAKKLRKAHAERTRWNTPRNPPKLQPPPHERVALMLEACEKKDARHFSGLCQELTLEEGSTHYGFSRFVKQTPGWAEATEGDQKRIVAAAKRLLTTDHDEAERAKSAPLNTMFVGQITAIWLVTEEDPAWLESLSTDWWRHWSWYFLRELVPNMSGEPRDQKQALLKKLHEKVPDDVRNAIRRLALSSEADTKDLLTSLLEVLDQIVDPILDETLCTELENAQVHEDRACEVAQFVLARNNGRAMPACLSRLESAADLVSEGIGVRTAVALLHQRAHECWTPVVDLLRRRPHLAVRVLSEFAHGDRYRVRHDDHPTLQQLGARHVGQLVALLLEHFPPEDDPDHAGAAYCVGPDDSARDLRNQLISWLGDQQDSAAVQALRDLERKFGARYSWLRRPRSRAERAYRLANWTPINPQRTAELLMAREKCLIRNGQDALDGVIAAINDYSRRLHSESPSEVDDLWNRPRRGRPTPKEEERFSDKICVAVRDYFRDFAVVADREVQIARRKLPADLGGAPGSELDVSVRIPSAGTVDGDPIKIVIEVKLSHNPEARAGLRDQLVNRYMRELGTDLGVYVVAWVEATGFRAVWPSMDAATNELQSLALAVMGENPNIDLRPVVLDATLPRAAATSSRKRRTRSKRTKKRKRASPKVAAAKARRVAPKQPVKRSSKRSMTKRKRKRP